MTEAPSPIDPEDAAILRRLTEMDMAAAEKAHAALMAAEAPPEIATALLAYQRAARSVRQTLMLKARLRRMSFEITPRPAPGRAGDSIGGLAEDLALGQRIEALQDAVGRVGAAAHPGDEARQRALGDAQDALIDTEVDRPDFLQHPLDAHVARQCEQLGLPRELAARWRELPPAQWTAFDDDVLDGPFDAPNDADRRDSG